MVALRLDEDNNSIEFMGGGIIMAQINCNNNIPSDNWTILRLIA